PLDSSQGVVTDILAWAVKFDSLRSPQQLLEQNARLKSGHVSAETKMGAGGKRQVRVRMALKVEAQRVREATRIEVGGRVQHRHRTPWGQAAPMQFHVAQDRPPGVDHRRGPPKDLFHGRGWDRIRMAP